MKATIKHMPVVNKTTVIRELREGQLAKVTGPIYTGDIVLRVYDAVVSLNNPARTWTINTPLQVEPLPAGTVVEIVSEW